MNKVNTSAIVVCWEVFPNFTRPGPRKTFIRCYTEITNLFCGIFLISMIVTTNNNTVNHIMENYQKSFPLKLIFMFELNINL